MLLSSVFLLLLVIRFIPSLQGILCRKLLCRKLLCRELLCRELLCRE
jgi:hypothetical protein